MVSAKVTKRPKAPSTLSAKTILRRYLSIWTGGNMANAARILDAAIVRHHPPSIKPPQVSGLENYAKYIAEFRAMHPDLRIEVSEMVANGKLVAYRYEASALNPATGQRFTFGGLSLSRFSRGKIVEEWITWDTHDLMVQVGLAPASVE